MFGTDKDKSAVLQAGRKSLKLILLGASFIYMAGLYWYVMGDMVFWRDEALPLLIARGNASLSDLFGAMGYEGTPGLWHILLWLTAKAAPLSPAHAKAIHFVFFAAFLFIVLFCYRVPVVLKLLFVFNYPLVTHYAFHVRQYQLAATLILLFFWLYAQEGHEKRVSLHLILFFLAQTCVHGLILAGVFFFFLAGNQYVRDKALWSYSCLISIAGMLLAVAQLMPPADLMPGVAAWDLSFSLVKSAKILWRLSHDTLFPKPMFGIKLAVLLAVLIGFGYLSANPPNRLFWICMSTAGVIFFLVGYGKYSGYRHHGLLSVTFLSYFLALVQKNPQPLRQRRMVPLALIPLIGIGLFECTSNAVYEHNRVRSHSQNVAEYLDQNYPDTPVLSKTEIFEAPVRLYRRHAVPVYALGRNAYVNYTVWNHPSVDFKSNAKAESFYWSDVIENILETPEEILKENPILVISGRLNIDEMNDLAIADLAEFEVDEKTKLTALKSFTGAKQENYYLFRLYYRPGRAFGE